MQLPKEIDTNKIIKKDAENINRILQETNKHLGKLQKNDPLGYFVLSWGLVEASLPGLIRLIFHRLSLKNIPNLERMSMSQLIKCYYFVSQDEELYKKLVEGNNLRNKILHEIYNNYDGNELRKSCVFVTENIFFPLLDRLEGKHPIPVLTLYANGWNDCRARTIKRLERLKETYRKEAS